MWRGEKQFFGTRRIEASSTKMSGQIFLSVVFPGNINDTDHCGSIFIDRYPDIFTSNYNCRKIEHPS